MQWVSRITTVALMVLLPILGGRKLDEMRETKYWGPIGLVLGLLLGAWQLRLIIADSKRSQADRSKSSYGKPQNEKSPREPPQST
jgi:hypothetical protein